LSKSTEYIKSLEKRVNTLETVVTVQKARLEAFEKILLSVAKGLDLEDSDLNAVSKLSSSINPGMLAVMR